MVAQAVAAADRDSTHTCLAKPYKPGCVPNASVYNFANWLRYSYDVTASCTRLKQWPFVFGTRRSRVATVLQLQLQPVLRKNIESAKTKVNIQQQSKRKPNSQSRASADTSRRTRAACDVV
uniref:Uncharacterized protein n=1 Tax=Hyaloperonospora arabidopsidis (strain Emoy2) TaxID=559515 RepID=M4BJU1_HYAAE